MKKNTGELKKSDDLRREFIVNQLARLEVFRDFRMMPAAGLREYRNWAERKVGEGDMNRVKLLIDECVAFESLPMLSDLSRIWESLFPPGPTASPSCQYCAGTGFEIVERGELSGAKRCLCGASPPADTVAA